VACRAQAYFNAAIAAGQSPGDIFATGSAPAAPLLPTLLPLAGPRAPTLPVTSVDAATGDRGRSLIVAGQGPGTLP
jgi:hypothetical protein